MEETKESPKLKNVNIYSIMFSLIIVFGLGAFYVIDFYRSIFVLISIIFVAIFFYHLLTVFHAKIYLLISILFGVIAIVISTGFVLNDISAELRDDGSKLINAPYMQQVLTAIISIGSIFALIYLAKYVRSSAVRGAITARSCVAITEILSQADFYKMLPKSQMSPSFLDASSGEGIKTKDGKIILLRKQSNSLLSSLKKNKSLVSIISSPLSLEVPHIYIDGKSDREGLFLNSVVQYDESQRVLIEGDFSKYFDVYFPKDTASIALSLLDPVLLQELKNVSRDYDLEIYNGRIYLITENPVLFDKDVNSKANQTLDKLVSMIESRSSVWNRTGYDSGSYSKKLVVSGVSSNFRLGDYGYAKISFFAAKWLRALIPLLCISLIISLFINIGFILNGDRTTAETIKSSELIFISNGLVIIFLYPAVLFLAVDKVIGFIDSVYVSKHS